MKDRPEVLVVDDEASIRLLIRLNLELEGFRVREAADGEQAISLLEEYEPDVILLDLRMPGIDGWGVITWLERQRRLQGSQVLVISAHANEETIGLARQKGLHYVTKPFKIDELVQAVSEATCPTDNRAHG